MTPHSELHSLAQTDSNMLYLQILPDISQSYSSRSESDCDCLTTGCLPSVNLSNRLVIETGHPEIESATLLTVHYNYLHSVDECKKTFFV